MARDCTHPKRNLRSVEDDWNAAPSWTTAAKGIQRLHDVLQTILMSTTELNFQDCFPTFTTQSESHRL